MKFSQNEPRVGKGYKKLMTVSIDHLNTIINFCWVVLLAGSITIFLSLFGVFGDVPQVDYIRYGIIAVWSAGLIVLLSPIRTLLIRIESIEEITAIYDGIYGQRQIEFEDTKTTDVD